MKNIKIFAVVCLVILANTGTAVFSKRRRNKLNLSKRRITDQRLARRNFREGIVKINLNDNLLKNPNLSNLPVSLKNLRISFNPLESISGLEHLENLEEMVLVSNKLSAINQLPSSLKLLSVSFNNSISDYGFLNGLGSLESLFALSNGIESLNNIQLPDSLRSIDLFDNKIKQVGNLPNKLESLSLASNLLLQVNEEDLPNTLKRLRVSSNFLFDLSISTFNDELEDLDLANNGIDNDTLEFFDYPTNLKKLRLERNLISNATKLQLHEGLEELNLKDNNLAFLEDLPELPSTLRLINLKKNPFTPKEAKRLRRALRRNNKKLKVRI